VATLEKIRVRQSTARGTELWQRIDEMRIEPPGAAITFTAKLARGNGWDRQLAEAVVQEYRRFLYLAATADGPVSPSQAVDKAWHLHLTFSRHYWDVLCGEILQRPLHHDPSLGGAAEDARHEHQYARTLNLYRDTFGQEPPPAIWPVPGTRPRQVTAFTGAAAAMVALLGAGAAAAPVNAVT